MACLAIAGGIQAAPLSVPDDGGYLVTDGLVSVVASPLPRDSSNPAPVPPLPQGTSSSGIAPEGVIVPLGPTAEEDASAWTEPDASGISGWSSMVQAVGRGTGWLDRPKQACWTVRAEAIALWRSAPANRPLLTTLSNYDPGPPATGILGPTVLNANQLNSNVLAAPRLTIARLDECGSGVEASYLYAGNFYARQSVPYSLNGYAIANPGIYGNTWGLDNPAPLDSAQQKLVSNLQTAEINLREPIGWGATRFLIGFRWIQWWETWTMTDQYSDTVQQVTGSDNYGTNCINNLYGGQIGLDTVLWNPGQSRMRVEGLVKAGAYYNASSQFSQYSYADSTGFSFARQIAVSSPGTASFAGEVGLTAVVPLRKNLDLRCGYFGLWLEGLASPTNQLSGQTLNQIDPAAGTIVNNGSAVLQGVSLGLEGRW